MFLSRGVLINKRSIVEGELLIMEPRKCLYPHHGWSVKIWGGGTEKNHLWGRYGSFLEQNNGRRMLLYSTQLLTNIFVYF